jgi:hypothetical protein
MELYRSNLLELQWQTKDKNIISVTALLMTAMKTAQAFATLLSTLHSTLIHPHKREERSNRSVYGHT